MQAVVALKGHPHRPPVRGEGRAGDIVGQRCRDASERRGEGPGEADGEHAAGKRRLVFGRAGPVEHDAPEAGMRRGADLYRFGRGHRAGPGQQRDERDQREEGGAPHGTLRYGPTTMSTRRASAKRFSRGSIVASSAKRLAPSPWAGMGRP